MAEPEVDNARELLAKLHTEDYGDIVVELLLYGNALQGEVVICSGSGDDTIAVSSSNITNEIVIRNLPCSTNSVSESSITDIIRQIIDGVCNVMAWSNDGVTTGLRVNYDDDTLKYQISI